MVEEDGSRSNSVNGEVKIVRFFDLGGGGGGEGGRGGGGGVRMLHRC